MISAIRDGMLLLGVSLDHLTDEEVVAQVAELAGLAADSDPEKVDQALRALVAELEHARALAGQSPAGHRRSG